MSGKIEIGTRVRVTHKAEHDSEYQAEAAVRRRSCDGLIGEVKELCFRVLPDDRDFGAWFEPDELTPAEPVESIADLRADLASTKAAHAEAERLLSDARDEIATLTESMRHAGEVIRAKDQARIEANLVRADLDALQAAVRGLTGREGDVAAMVGDLAHVGRVFGDVVSLRADLQAARDTLSKVSAAVDAVRLAWEGEAAENVIAALDAVDRALRGVPAPASEARQCEACTAANGTATFHASEEPCDPRECPAPGPWAHEVEARIAALSDRLTTLEERTGFATGTIAGSVQARVSLPIHWRRPDMRIACADQRPNEGATTIPESVTCRTCRAIGEP